jgi:hypothetical protein
VVVGREGGGCLRTFPFINLFASSSLYFPLKILYNQKTKVKMSNNVQHDVTLVTMGMTSKEIISEHHDDLNLYFHA